MIGCQHSLHDFLPFCVFAHSNPSSHGSITSDKLFIVCMQEEGQQKVLLKYFVIKVNKKSGIQGENRKQESDRREKENI